MKDPGQFRRRYGPTAVVTGAARGIGEAFSRALSRRGLDLVLIDRDPRPLSTLTGELLARGHSVEAVVFDLASSELAERAAAIGRDHEVGLLVSNAAVTPLGPLLGQPPEPLLEAIDVNCRAPTVLAQIFGASMARRGRGGVIMMSSLAGLQGSPLVAIYAATKAYNLVLAEGLWEELSASGVDALACVAGLTDTPALRSSTPRIPPLIAPMVMAPEVVVEQALEALGHQPALIAGRHNWLTAALTRALLTRRQAVSLFARNLERLYGDP